MNLPTGPDTTPVTLYNPLQKDFTVQMADDHNEPHFYTIPSLDTATYPKYIADHIMKHLAQKIALSRDARVAYDIRYEEAVKLIKADI